MAMVEVLFKAKEGDRNQQIKKLKTEMGQYKQNLLKFDQQRFVSEELEADSYQRLKAHTLEQIDRLNTRYGMSLLKDLTLYFQEAGLEAKRKLLGSIFPAKLTFQDGKYRTDGLNPALTIILQKTNNFQKEKTGDIAISENVSGDVPMTGRLSNHIVEGMRKIYELERFIKLESSVTGERSKGSKIYKKAV